MTPTPPSARLACATALCAIALAGCGSATKTESVAETAPAEEATTSTSTQTTSTTAAPATTTAPSSTSTAGGTSAPSTTRTAPEPAFAQSETSAEGIRGAATLVRAHGYTPNETSQYHPSQTLRVLVGTRTGSPDGYGQQAFFFIGDRYIGTDAKEPSATVTVVSQSDTQVTLSYPLYRAGDPLASPRGHAAVQFQLNDGKLAPQGTIPPANSSTGLSRN